ncbi:hypothetical protein TNIN_264621, partial [Trichonephila inaurata madagascariensis]
MKTNLIWQPIDRLHIISVACISMAPEVPSKFFFTLIRMSFSLLKPALLTPLSRPVTAQFCQYFENTLGKDKSTKGSMIIPNLWLD